MTLSRRLSHSNVMYAEIGFCSITVLNKFNEMGGTINNPPTLVGLGRHIRSVGGDFPWGVAWLQAHPHRVGMTRLKAEFTV